MPTNKAQLEAMSSATAAKDLIKIGVRTTRIHKYIFPRLGIKLLKSLWKECHGTSPAKGGSVAHLVQHYGKNRLGLIELSQFSEIYLKTIGGESLVEKPNSQIFHQSIMNGQFIRAWQIFESTFSPQHLTSSNAILCARDLCTKGAKMVYCNNCKRRYIHIYDMEDLGEQIAGLLPDTQEKRAKQHQKCQYCLLHRKASCLAKNALKND
jgi:hypothetical protein